MALAFVSMRRDVCSGQHTLLCSGAEEALFRCAGCISVAHALTRVKKLLRCLF